LFDRTRCPHHHWSRSNNNNHNQASLEDVNNAMTQISMQRFKIAQSVKLPAETFYPKASYHLQSCQLNDTDINAAFSSSSVTQASYREILSQGIVSLAKWQQHHSQYADILSAYVVAQVVSVRY
jgi:hypothetical protein